MTDSNRIVVLDCLRVIACFMVLVVLAEHLKGTVPTPIAIGVIGEKVSGEPFGTGNSVFVKILLA